MTSSRLLCTWVAALALAVGGCSNNDTTGSAGTGGAARAGTTSSGGTSTGGVSGDGGSASPVTGASGGQTTTGGRPASGGQTGSGGVAASGGAPASGGTTTATTPGSGGQPPAAGGATGKGGVTGHDAGPDSSTDGGGNAAGGNGSGGTSAVGGSTGAGGSTASGDLHAPGNPPVKSAGCGKTPTLKTGTQTITSSSQQRQYIIDIPTDYDNSKPYRLIFGLHWMGGTMTDVATGQTVKRDVWSYFGLKRLDSPRSAIFVAPQGIGNGWANTNGQDTILLDDIIKTIEDDLCIDKTRIFAGGFSYGGMFSSTLACTRSDVYRALAPQNGSGSCSSPKPVAFFASGSTDGTNQSLQSYARVFAKANGCADPQQAMPIPTAGSKLHTCTSFTGCPAAYPVRFCAFDEGHKAAPCDGCGPQEDNGDTTWTPGEVWKFYTQF